MKRVDDKRISKLKRKSIWPHIVSFLVSISLGALLILITVSAVVTYMVSTKYFDDSSSAGEVRSAIESGVEEGKSIDAVLEDMENRYKHPLAVTVMDANGDVVASYGNKLNKKDAAILDEENLDVDISFSEKSAKKQKNKANNIRISIKKVFRGIDTDAFEKKDGVSISKQLRKEAYSFDYWIKCSESKDYEIYVYFKQTLTVNDCLFVILSAALAGIVFVVFAIISLITALSNIFAQRALLKVILRDRITGGYNYLAFNTTATKVLCSAFKKKNAYAIVDLSLFKYQSYNSLYGAKEGERLLYAMDKYFNKNVKRGEIVSRVNGADFVMLLKLDKQDGEANLTKRVVQIINSFVDGVRSIPLKDNVSKDEIALKGLNNAKINAGIYIVAAAVDDESKARRKRENINVDQLYIKAGIARKELGDDACIKFYNHEMLEEEMWEQKVEDKMQEALDNEEFQVYIQPKYNPSTNELAGGEALVRWISKEDGFVSPGKFIPIFEKTGFVTKLDDYMISHTAKLQSKWLSEGKNIVPISVNVSRAHFAQPDLAEHIRDLVDAYPLPHKYIEIELTESAFFDDKNALITTVTKLQEYGFEVSMDDFGSGYSSLNSLKDLPLNVLKLDAEFFRGEDSFERGEIVVSKAIALAKQLNMRIVAEGVEKKEQVDFLAKQDCDMIQGFYFDKPMPANEYETRMK